MEHFANFAKSSILDVWLDPEKVHIFFKQLSEAYLELVEHPRWSFYAEIFNDFKPLTIFANKLQRRFSTGF